MVNDGGDVFIDFEFLYSIITFNILYVVGCMLFLFSDLIVSFFFFYSTIKGFVFMYSCIHITYVCTKFNKSYLNKDLSLFLKNSNSSRFYDDWNKNRTVV